MFWDLPSPSTTSSSWVINDAALAEAEVDGLVRLDVGMNPTVTTVSPFGRALRVLYANQSGLDDAGLAAATNLVCLDVSYLHAVRTLAMCASSLLRLEAVGRYCGIGDAALSAVTLPCLMHLNVVGNVQVSTVAPFGLSLRHLQCEGSKITRQSLARSAPFLASLTI